MKGLLAIVCCFLLTPAGAQQAYFATPAKGFTSWQPASSWEHALLSGNGTMGAMVMGQPHDETIILSHSQLYLPQKRSEKLIDQASHLTAIRQLLLADKGEEAAAIPVNIRKQEGYNDARDPFIPAFDVRVAQEPSNVLRYQRSVNFETGEAIVDWQDGVGTFQRKIFISRRDSVIALSIRGTAKINCTISFERRPVEWNQWGFVNEHIQSSAAGIEGKEWLHYSTEFKIKNRSAIHAYEGLGRLILRNGSASAKGNRLVVANADEVLILIKIQPLCNAALQTTKLKEELAALNETYDALLSRHVLVHGRLFNRVALNLAAEGKDRSLHAEELLLKGRDTVTAAMIERAFDAGRYNIISATGINPPNLQGIWSGTWTAPWTGGMTHDGNLPTAISMNLPGNTPELMHSYFNYHKRLMPDYRAAAKALYNSRGIHIPAQATTTGLDTDFGNIWCLTFWTGGAGWVSNFFWDYYQYTLDKNFLLQQAYPFMREAALFYEDFLQIGRDGNYIFNPSYSPENNPSNKKSQATINATMDVMIAKQLLRNCIAASIVLNSDLDKRKVWSAMLDKIPAYGVSKSGALKEWMWEGYEENSEHRHASHLYALFDEVSPEFRNDSDLRSAAHKVISEKVAFREKEGGGEMAFGLVQLGAAAAHLGDSKTAYKLVQWLASRYWATGMGSYHNVNNLFNTDISGGLPYLVTQMLAYSEQGLISLLPALPAEWKEGTIEGLLLRGNIALKRLKWSAESVEVHLMASQPQTVTIQLPFSTRLLAEKNIASKQDPNSKAFELRLPANRDLILKFEKNAGNQD